MQRRWTRTLIALTAISLLAAGCGDDSDDEDATETTAEPAGTGDEVEATTVEVTAVDYRYTEAPTTIEGGLVELSFTNDGTVPHEIAFAEIGDVDLATFITDFGPVVEGEGGGPIPDYAEAIAVGGEIGPGETDSSTFLLPAGEYVAFCTLDGAAPDESASTTTEPGSEGATGEPHYKLGMAQTITVTEGDADADLPEAESSVVASDYAFEVDVQAGESTMAFRNEGPGEIHHAVFFPFAEGITEDDAATALDAFLTSEEEGPPPAEFDFEGAPKGLADSGVFSSGLGEVYDQEFTAGRTYAVVCFLSDRAGGPPHAIAHDMKKIFTVD